MLLPLLLNNLLSDGSTPVVVAEQSSGGWFFPQSYELLVSKRRQRLREQQEREAEAEQIQNELDREIAQLLREQEAKDTKRAELERLRALVTQSPDLEAARRYSERVAKAYQKALENGSRRALIELEREMKRAQEEEEFILLAIAVNVLQ